MSAYWVGVYFAEMRAIRAEEALIETERRQLASGLMKKTDGDKIIRRWRRDAGQEQRAAHKGTPDEQRAANMGLGVRK